MPSIVEHLIEEMPVLELRDVFIPIMSSPGRRVDVRVQGTAGDAAVEKLLGG